jgi:TPP-dependent 2-oxoacid decarboxylase
LHACKTGFAPHALQDLPVIVISGVPNSNDYASNRVLHHTTGLPDYDQQVSPRLRTAAAVL